MSSGQFYPEPADVIVFKPSDGLDPFFISWALAGHRTFLQGGAKHQRYKCAGCLVCPEGCTFTARPHTRSHEVKCCGNVRQHGGRQLPLTLQPCKVEFHYKLDFSSGIVELKVTGEGHPHSKPPPKGPGPAAVAELSAAIRAGGKKPSPTAMLMGSQGMQADTGAQDVGRLQRKIAELYKDRYGFDLSVVGLGRQNFGEPFVRDVRIAFGEQACAETNFEFVYLQLDGQRDLVKDLASPEGVLTSKYFYADVIYNFGSTYRLTIMGDSLESGKGVTLAVVFMTRLHTRAYARAFFTFFKQNPELWTAIDTRLELLFCCVVVDFSDSQRNGFILAIQQLWEENCTTPFFDSLPKMTTRGFMQI